MEKRNHKRFLIITIKLIIVIIIVFTKPISAFSLNGNEKSPKVVKGKVKDQKSGETIVGATIIIKGTTIGAVTDIDGNYVLTNIPESKVIIVCSFVSYKQQEMEIEFRNENTKVIDFELAVAEVNLEEIKVVGKSNRESDKVLLLEQKKAAIISESIGAKELSIKGVSDVAAATTKITGITRQEGTKSLNVRGLGDRYNTTTLNGLPLPSNNAEVKNIDLALFSTDIISNIDVEKSFSPYIYGDFGGANVNIVSKRYTGSKFLKVSVDVGYNSALMQTDKLVFQDGPNYSGFYNSKQPNIENLRTKTDYGFTNSWNPVEKNISPGLGLGLSGGKSFSIGSKNARLNTFFNVSFENSSAYSTIQRKNVNGTGDLYKDLFGDRYTNDTQTTGIINLNYSKANHEIYYNILFLNSTEQYLEQDTGLMHEENGDLQFFRRSEFERNILIVNQLIGEHSFSDKLSLKWGTAFNYVDNIIPDRRQNVFQDYDPETNIGVFSEEPTGKNYRYFHEFTDKEIASNITLNRFFGDGILSGTYKGKFSLGYSGRFKKRDFQSNQFNHNIYLNREVGEYVYSDVNNIDGFLNNENLINNEFSVREIVSGGFWYKGKVSINALFTSLEYNFSPKFLLLIGSRFEKVNQEIKYHSNQGDGDAAFDNFKVLPSVTAKYAYSNSSNIRFSSSKTYNLPQINEMPDFIFEGVTEEIRGNPFLYPSTVYNFEIKWETFPKNSELLSVALFSKNIENPISRFITGSSSEQYSIANSGKWAYVYGLEVDVKKDIISISNATEQKVVFISSNLTLMDSRQDLDEKKVISETSGNGKPISVNFNSSYDKLQGAAGLIFNTSLGYKLDWIKSARSLSAVLVYNHVSERIYSLGYQSVVGNRVDLPEDNLDIVIKSSLNNFELSFTVKNILNKDITRSQYNNDVTWLSNSFNKGIFYKVGLAYQF